MVFVRSSIAAIPTHSRNRRSLRASAQHGRRCRRSNGRSSPCKASVHCLEASVLKEACLSEKNVHLLLLTVTSDEPVVRAVPHQDAKTTQLDVTLRLDCSHVVQPSAEHAFEAGWQNLVPLFEHLDVRRDAEIPELAESQAEVISTAKTQASEPDVSPQSVPPCCSKEDVSIEADTPSAEDADLGVPIDSNAAAAAARAFLARVNVHASEAPEQETTQSCELGWELGSATKVVPGPLATCIRKRRVSFDIGAPSIHEVVPYSEIYGLHPRHFVFDRHSNLVPAGDPFGFTGLRTSDEDPCTSEFDEEVVDLSVLQKSVEAP